MSAHTEDETLGELMTPEDRDADYEAMLAEANGRITTLTTAVYAAAKDAEQSEEAADASDDLADKWAQRCHALADLAVMFKLTCDKAGIALEFDAPSAAAMQIAVDLVTGRVKAAAAAKAAAADRAAKPRRTFEEASAELAAS